MHILQPKHSKLKEKEVNELLEKLKISKAQLPKIKNTDPAIKELDCNIGEVIKIERNIDGKEDIYYRVVIAGK